MSKIEDGGPAFPLFADGRAATNIASLANEGMTLRDWFAGQALAGMLAHSRGGHGYQPRNPNQHWHDAIAEESVEIADAMLEARKPKSHATYKQEFDG